MCIWISHPRLAATLIRSAYLRPDFNIPMGSVKLSASKICGGSNGRILYEMQDETRDSQPDPGDAQEWQTGDPGYLFGMWDKSIPDR